MESIQQLVMGTMLALLLFMTKIESISPDSQSSPSSSSSIYEILKSYGLPMGLFPKGISDFSLDPATGCFQLHLFSPSPCDAKFETRVRYEYNITGTLGYGEIANLSGIAAQELFLWLPVKGIRVDIPSSGLIYFDVGMVFKQFSLSFFETPKECAVVAKGDGGNDVVLSDDQKHIVENSPGKLIRNHYEGNAWRAASSI